MRQLLLITVLPIVYSLRCKDIVIGSANGSSFNFENTLKCPSETKWCMNLNISFYSSLYSIEGIFGNCESNGFIGSVINFTRPMLDLSCKKVGYEMYPAVNLTKYCCNTDLCNYATKCALFIPILMLLMLRLLCF